MVKHVLIFTLAASLFYGCSNKVSAPQFFSKTPFPSSWVGYWSSDLQIYSPQGVQQVIPMALEIAPTKDADIFKWVIIYDQQSRNYELKITDPKNEKYVIDEKNSILIEAYLWQNQLISSFEVNGNWITCIYEKQGERLLFSIVAGKTTPVSETGGELFEGNEIPIVKTFPISGNQKGILKRR